MCQRLRGRVDDQRAPVSVEQDDLTVGDRIDQPGDADDRGQSERPGQDGRVRRRRSLFCCEAHDQRAVEPGSLRRCQVASDHNRRLRGRGRHITHPVQGAPDLLDHILDVRRSRPEYFIVRGAQHLGKRRHRFPDGGIGRPALSNQARCAVEQSRIIQHECLGLQNPSLGHSPTRLEPSGFRGQRELDVADRDLQPIYPCLTREIGS